MNADGLEGTLQAVRRSRGQAHVRRRGRLCRRPVLRHRAGRRSLPEGRRALAARLCRRRLLAVHLRGQGQADADLLLAPCRRSPTKRPTNCAAGRRSGSRRRGARPKPRRSRKREGKPTRGKAKRSRARLIAPIAAPLAPREEPTPLLRSTLGSRRNSARHTRPTTSPLRRHERGVSTTIPLPYQAVIQPSSDAVKKRQSKRLKRQGKALNPNPAAKPENRQTGSRRQRRRSIKVQRKADAWSISGFTSCASLASDVTSRPYL